MLTAWQSTRRSQDPVETKKPHVPIGIWGFLIGKGKNLLVDLDQNIVSDRIHQNILHPDFERFIV